MKRRYVKPAFQTSVAGHEGKNEGKERRRVPRFPFVGSAEATESISKTSIRARVTELSLYGCYLEMPNPLPRGSQVFIKIFTDTAFFEASASVVYTQPNLGIGLAFHDVNPHFLPTLRRWLLEAINAAKPMEGT